MKQLGLPEALDYDTLTIDIFMFKLSVSEGKRYIHGRLAYAPQTAWTFQSTVKENIVFGNSFNQQRLIVPEDS